MLRHPHPHRLRIVLGVSLAMHLAVLAGWRVPPLRLDLGVEPVRFSVALHAIEVSPAAPGSMPKPVPRQVGTAPVAAPRPAARQAAAAAPAAAARRPSQVDKPRPPADKPALRPALNRAHVITRLRRDLARYFTYPPLARRRNMEGTVLLSFDVTNEGRIEHVGVRHSSGYAILDVAAQQAMQRLARLDWLAGRLEQGRMNIELPVIYTLTES